MAHDTIRILKNMCRFRSIRYKLAEFIQRTELLNSAIALIFLAVLKKNCETTYSPQ